MVKRLLILLLLASLWQLCHAQRESAELKALRQAVAEVDSSDLRGRALALKELGLGLKEAKRYKPALAAVNESDSLNTTSQGPLEFSIELARLRAEVLTLLRDLPGALASVEHADRLERLVLQKAMDDELRALGEEHALSLKAEAAERERIIAEAKAEAARAEELQDYGAIALGLLALIAVLAVVMLLRAKQQRGRISRELESLKQEQAVQKDRFEQLEDLLRLKSLRDQLGPHFVYSSLSAIGHMLRKNDSIRASATLDGMLRLMAMALEQGQKEQVTLEEEIAFLRQYLKMEGLRRPEGLDYSVEAEPAMLYRDTPLQVPAMLLQPVVQNVLLERLSQDLSAQADQGRKQLRVHFSTRDGKLLATVEDNGLSLGAAAPIGHSAGSEASEVQFSKERMLLLAQRWSSERIQQRILKEGERVVGSRVELLLS